MDTKTCTKCGGVKPLAEFHLSKLGLLGREARCRTCKAMAQARHYKSPRVQQHRKKLHREWYASGGKAIVQKNVKTFRERTGYPGYSNPRHQHARNLAQAAIRRGRIVRKPCEMCGATKAEAHHDDYSRPLDVRFLCNKCHRKVHDT